MVPYLYFDAVWNPSEGWNPPDAAKTSRRLMVEITCDPFAVKTTAEAAPQFREIVTETTDHLQHNFILMTNYPELMRPVVTRCGEDTFPRTIEVNTHSGITVPFPPPNLILGTIVWDQNTALTRVPMVWQTPASRRILLYDPLGPLDFSEFDAFSKRPFDWLIVNALTSLYSKRTHKVELRHIESAIKQCAHRKIPVFVSRLGNNVWDEGKPALFSRTGAELNEWPKNVRVRQRLDEPWECPDFVPDSPTYEMCEFCGAPTPRAALKQIRERPTCPNCRERFEHPTQIAPSVAAFEIRAEAQTQIIMSGMHNIEAIRQAVEKEAENASPAEAATLEAAAKATALKPTTPPDHDLEIPIHEAVAICGLCEIGRRVTELLISTDGRLLCLRCFQTVGGTDARKWEGYYHFLRRKHPPGSPVRSNPPLAAEPLGPELTLPEDDSEESRLARTFLECLSVATTEGGLRAIQESFGTVCSTEFTCAFCRAKIRASELYIYLSRACCKPCWKQNNRT